MRAQFYFVRVHYLFIYLTCVFSSLNNVFILLCIVFLTHIYVLFATVLALWVAPPECSAIGIGFNGAETNCRIAHILGILLMNSCNTDRFLATTVVCGLSTLK